MLHTKMEHIVANWSAHNIASSCKQHQKICKQICLRVLCELGLRAIES